MDQNVQETIRMELDRSNVMFQIKHQRIYKWDRRSSKNEGQPLGTFKCIFIMIRVSLPLFIPKIYKGLSGYNKNKLNIN